MKLALSILLALAPSALAQLHFTEPTPLTTTRYGAFGGDLRLTTDGTDAFLAWSADGKVRMTRLTDGERRVGRPVLEVDPFHADWFDVVWTGDHFLVAALQCTSQCFVAGRIVDATGEAVGDPFTIQSEEGKPRLSFDGERVLMVYGPANYKSVFLDRDGLNPNHPLVYGSLSSAGASVASAGGTNIVAVPELGDVFILALTSEASVIGTPHFKTTTLANRIVATASGESEFFIIWTNGDAPMEYAYVNPRNATISGRTTLPETGGTSAVAAAWEVDHWTVAWITGGASHVLRLQSKNNAPGHLLSPQPADDDSPVAALSLHGHTIVASRGTGEGAPITVRHLDGGTDLGAFAAAEQTLESTATSAESALLTFSETRDGRSTLYAGLRGVDGSWRETKLGDGQHAPLAASDGSNFAVITTTTSNDWGASILDRHGRLVNVSPRAASFMPTGITWTGSGYAIVGINGAADLVAYVISPTATITGPTLLVQHHDDAVIENPVIAARDGEALVVWQDSTFIPCFPICDPYASELRAARLSPSLQRLDVTPLLIAPDEAIYPGVVWDGSHYVIAWNSGQKLQWRTLTSHGSVSGISEAAGLQPLVEGPRVSLVNASDSVVGMTMTNGDALVLSGGNTLSFPSLGRDRERDALIGLAGQVTYVQATPHDEMPYHGARRLHLLLGDFLQTTPADGPRITRAHYVGDTMELTWTRPIAPVNGYRIEYRVNDGYWNELDAWFDADETTLEIEPWRGTGVTYQFRVRAMSDAGPGAYSKAAIVRSGVRRRAAR